MAYIIKHRNGTYFHNNGRILLYETPEQAMRFLQDFINYAMNRLAQGGANQIEMMTAPMTIQSNSVIMEVDFDVDNVECGTVYVTDI